MIQLRQADRPKVKQLTHELLQLKCHALWVKRPLHQLVTEGNWNKKPRFHHDFTSHRG